MKIHAGIMEVAVANLLNYRLCTIVPNVSYGLGLNHECDLLALDRDKRFTEVEIKISMSDLKADFKKSHSHKSEYITRLVYAVPEEMLDKAMGIIPKEYGIITVKHYTSHYNQIPVYSAHWVRNVRHRKQYKQIPQRTLDNFYRLGCMRIWTLKQHNNKIK